MVHFTIPCEPMVNGVLIGIICFILFLSNVCFFHVFKIRRHFRFMAVMFVSTLVFYIILYLLFFDAHLQRFASIFIPIEIFAFWHGLFLHFSSCYLYLYLIQVIDRSPSTRIMVEILYSQERKLTLTQIKQRYNIDKRVSDKIEEMILSGYVKKEADGYMLTDRGRKCMGVFKAIRNYLKLERN